MVRLSYQRWRRGARVIMRAGMADAPVRVTTQPSSARKKGMLGMIANPRGLWRFLRDPGASKFAKLSAILAVLYIVSPVDALPDYVVPLLGFLDDLGFTAVALAYIASQAAKYENAKLEAGERREAGEGIEAKATGADRAR